MKPLQESSSVRCLEILAVVLAVLLLLVSSFAFGVLYESSRPIEKPAPRQTKPSKWA